MAMTTRPKQDDGSLDSRLKTAPSAFSGPESRADIRCASTWLWDCTGSWLSSRPRIEHFVKEIGKQVQADEDDPDNEHAGHDSVHVADQHVVRHVLSEARPGEHCLDQHSSLKQAAIGQRHDSHELHADVGEGVVPDRPAVREALNPRGDHIFLVQLIQHEAARHAGDIGHRRIAEHAGRQEQDG